MVPKFPTHFAQGEIILNVMDAIFIGEKIRTNLQGHGIELYGWTRLTRPLSIDLYKNWILQGEHLDMRYLEQHIHLKEKPRDYRQAQSAIVFAIPYLPHPWPSETNLKNSTALYSQGLDYHLEIPKYLEPLLSKLRTDFPGEQFEVFTDAAPILERDLAYRAGLGWIGKNTCLINPKKGSLFLLAEIYTTLELPVTKLWNPDFCGNCSRCIEACPTQALLPERKLQPSKCISYWTIEAKSVPPENLRENFGDWLFGCDICQTVCPWNQKHLKQKAHPLNSRDTDLQIKELEWILTTSRKALARDFKNTPLARATGWKLQRNALIVAANKGFKTLIPVIEKWKTDAKLANLAQWALSKLRQEDSEEAIHQWS